MTQTNAQPKLPSTPFMDLDHLSVQFTHVAELHQYVQALRASAAEGEIDVLFGAPKDVELGGFKLAFPTFAARNDGRLRKFHQQAVRGLHTLAEHKAEITTESAASMPAHLLDYLIKRQRDELRRQTTRGEAQAQHGKEQGKDRRASSGETARTGKQGTPSQGKQEQEGQQPGEHPAGDGDPDARLERTAV